MSKNTSIILFAFLSIPLFCASVVFVYSYTDDLPSAIRWQMESKGVLAISRSPWDFNRRYKNLIAPQVLTKDKSINTLINGSSAMLSVQSDFLPQGLSAYNLAKNNHTTNDTISETFAFISKYPQIKNVIIGLDVFFPYLHQEPKITKNIIKKYNKSSHKTDKFLEALKNTKDATQVQIALKSIIDKESFNSQNEYQCPSDKKIKGLDMRNPKVKKSCTGLKLDGSHTFWGFPTVTSASYPSAINPKRMQFYTNMLKNNKGDPKQVYFQELINMDKILKNRKGGLIIYVPPTIPGFLDKIKQSPQYPKYKTTLKAINSLKSKNILIINATNSALYRCDYTEFFDAHHALPSCAAKIFTHESMSIKAYLKGKSEE